MAKNKNLSNFTRTEIIALHKQGQSNNQISKTLKIARRTVDYNVNKFKVTKSVNNRRGKTRKKTSTAEDKYIVNLSLRDRKLTVPDVTTHVNKCFKNQVSTATIRRRLIKAGLKGRVAVKKPLLRSINKKKD